MPEALFRPMPMSSDMLVVFGGPQSRAPPAKIAHALTLAPKQRPINQAISARRMVIGICLGSQLIGGRWAPLCAKVRKKLVTTYYAH